jgi:hypothetical protein
LNWEMTKMGVYSIGGVAEVLSKRLGCHIEGWQIRRAIKRGHIQEPARVGPTCRVFTEDELSAVVAGLRRAGYVEEVPA